METVGSEFKRNDREDKLFMRIILVFFTSLFVGCCFLFNMYLPLLLFAFIAYIVLLFRYPEIALFISFLVIINCFSLINADFLRMPNFFKIRDIFFVSIFLPLLGGIYKKDEKLKIVFSSPVAIGIYIILFLACIQIFITKLRFGGESFNSIIKTGRVYFYYALFFPAFYILTDSIRLKRFVILSVGSVILFSLLYILQFLVGSQYTIFLWAVVAEQNLQGFGITRMYITGMIAATLLFHISLMIFLFRGTSQYRIGKLNVFVLCITALQSILTFGRAHIFGIFTGILFGISCARGQQKFKSILKISFYSLALIFFYIASQVFLPQKENVFKAFFVRTASTYNAINDSRDTFMYRLNDSMGRIELIKENALIGVGFVHDESKLFAHQRGGNESLRTTDSGMLTLLIDFGFFGAVWLIVMAIIVLKRSINIYREVNDPMYKSLVLGIVAFFFGRLFPFITLSDFVVYDGIMIISMSLVALELINYHILLKKNERKRVIDYYR